MTQEIAWEKEYKNSKLLTKDNKPQSDVVSFVKFLKKEFKKNRERGDGLKNFDGISVLDLGSGTGRNSFYFTELGAECVGLEISQTAIDIARENARKAGLHIEYHKQSMGNVFPCADHSIDIILDVTSSNSLTESEREVYMKETKRVLKPHGYFFIKALCKDGDEHAKFLIKHHSGSEADTYVLPDVGVVERVWTREDFIRTYEKYFTIIYLEKKTTYSRMNGRSYKRNFWVGYMTATPEVS